MSKGVERTVGICWLDYKLWNMHFFLAHLSKDVDLFSLSGNFFPTKIRMKYENAGKTHTKDLAK